MRDRRRSILLAAEKLFALHGYDAVSIRQIADEVDVPLALVGYYLGPKQALFQAIFAAWSRTIDERLAALHLAATTPLRAGRLKLIVQAFVKPVLRMRASPEGEFHALLVARELLLHWPETDQVLTDHFDPMAHAFIDALVEALPGAARTDVVWCHQFTLGALVNHMSDARIERLSCGQARANDPAAHAMLLRFMESGIRAVMLSRASRRTASPHQNQECPMMLRRTLIATAALAAAATFAALPASAQQVIKLTAVAGHPPAFPWVKTFDDIFISAVENA